MNRYHRRCCASAGWAERMRQVVMPWVLDGLDLGPAVVEIGPGPGVTTDVLRERGHGVTAAEVDAGAAAALARRVAVPVCAADGAALPFADASFTGAACCTMLHHVPSAARQDALLAEARRVLRPGGWLAGCDSRVSLRFRAAHLFDTMVAVDPATFPARLAAAGFVDAEVEVGERSFRFRARRPRQAPGDRSSRRPG
ncbi:MAG TPA: class I SAM-dependent methyltransferase [Acidimicrobiales bacterium]